MRATVALHRYPDGCTDMTDVPPQHDAPAAPASADLPTYRREATDSLQTSEQLHELLPVTSLRVWLLVVAAALLVAGTLAYAAVTPRDVTVSGAGRVTGNQGVTLVTATAAGQFGRLQVRPGSTVKAGQVVAEIIAGDEVIEQRVQRNGILLGYLPRPGDPVDVGSWLAEISNGVDDGRSALIIVDPDEAGKVQAGMPVKVAVRGGPEVTGVVTGDRSDSMSAARVQEGLGLLEPPAGPRVVIALDLGEAAPRGYEIDATVLVSQRTLLQQLLGMS